MTNISGRVSIVIFFSMLSMSSRVNPRDREHRWTLYSLSFLNMEGDMCNDFLNSVEKFEEEYP